MLGCRSAAGAVARLGALALLGFLLGTVPSAAELNYWSREAQASRQCLLLPSSRDPVARTCDPARTPLGSACRRLYRFAW